MVFNSGVILWQAWNRSLHKVWETTMKTQRRCGRICLNSQKYWLETAAFGHSVEHYNISSVAPTESYKMSERNIFLLQPFEHQQICKLKRQAMAGQRTAKLLLVLNDAHNHINNPTVQIADPGKQNTLLLGNYTTNRRTISHHDGNVCSYHHDTPF